MVPKRLSTARLLLIPSILIIFCLVLLPCLQYEYTFVLYNGSNIFCEKIFLQSVSMSLLIYYIFIANKITIVIKNTRTSTLLVHLHAEIHLIREKLLIITFLERKQQYCN